jgi:tRNA modification GTPase
MALPDQSEGEGIIVSNLRHLEALKACDKMLETTVQGINENRSTELIAMDVRQALHHLGLITGEVSTDDLLSNIFSRFCIGK